MKSKLTWLEVALLAAPLIVLTIYWHDLPARVPVHWNVRGQVDNWGAKVPGLLLLPLTMLGVIALLHVLPSFDPRLQRTGGEQSRMPAVLPIIRIALLLLFNTIFLVRLQHR